MYYAAIKSQIQKAKITMNYFELLEIKREHELDYALDSQVLTKQYFTMQKRFHPDKARNNEEKRSFLKITIDLNAAYDTLRADLKRAEYLLNLYGISLSDTEIRARMSPEQLNKIWQEMEELENINGASELQSYYEQKDADRTLLLTELTAAFARKNIEEALDLTLKLKYLTTIIDNTKKQLLASRDANNRN